MNKTRKSCIKNHKINNKIVKINFVNNQNKEIKL
jgi:hypothetical protein